MLSATKHRSSMVYGKKLDDFEGEVYAVIPVQATVIGEGQVVNADIYLWNGERHAVLVDHWDLDVFIRERSG